MKGSEGMGQDLFDVLVEYIVENQAKLYRVAYCYVNNQDDALDVVQNAICKALENYCSLRNPDAIKTWLYRILVNESLNFIKKKKREISCEPGEMVEEIYLETAFEADETIYEEVRKLPEDLQTVIMLHFYEELTLKEVSQVTGVNLNTVKTRLYSAMRKLRTNMQEVS